MLKFQGHTLFGADDVLKHPVRTMKDFRALLPSLGSPDCHCEMPKPPSPKADDLCEREEVPEEYWYNYNDVMFIMHVVIVLSTKSEF